MNSRLRPSPAMVVALIALFVALGGSAAALSSSNTVQTDDLGPGSQVTAPDVAANAVNGSDVVNNSLTGADTALVYSRPQATYPSPTTFDESSTKQLTVDCPAGSKVTGGGYILDTQNGLGIPQLNAVRSYAVDENTWMVRGVEVNDSLVGDWHVTVVANCLNG